jgi:hypothetical protein
MSRRTEALFFVLALLFLAWQLGEPRQRPPTPSTKRSPQWHYLRGVA